MCARGSQVQPLYLDNNYVVHISIGACICDVIQTIIPVGSLGQQTKEQIGWK